MRFTRLIAGLTTAGLLGLAPVAISSPADAATTYTTTSSIAASAPEVTYGDDSLSINGAVTTPDGGSVYTGSVALQVYSAKNPVWTTIQTDDSAGSYYFFDIKPDSNSLYKVVYSGITETNGDVYTPSESAPLAVGVKRKAVFKTPGLFLVGKIKPDFKRKKVVLKRKKGKKYVAWKKVRTNKKGVFRVKAPNKRGFKFSVTIPADKKYSGFTDYYQVY
ncbi:hypothetical protein [Nocardioides terrigena]|uniref:hypothetical protein n=1 Tax=Nocardioides terrigena TaxID=424797 RepID=UPI000D30ED3B|nr:hypothetical protein [Nocardioides terrigena]